MGFEFGSANYSLNQSEVLVRLTGFISVGLFDFYWSHRIYISAIALI